MANDIWLRNGRGCCFFPERPWPEGSRLVVPGGSGGTAAENVGGLDEVCASGILAGPCILATCNRPFGLFPMAIGPCHQAILAIYARHSSHTMHPSLPFNAICEHCICGISIMSASRHQSRHALHSRSCIWQNSISWHAWCSKPLIKAPPDKRHLGY